MRDDTLKQRRFSSFILPLTAVGVGGAAGLILAAFVITRRWGQQPLWFLRGA